MQFYPNKQFLIRIVTFTFEFIRSNDTINDIINDIINDGAFLSEDEKNVL